MNNDIKTTLKEHQQYLKSVYHNIPKYDKKRHFVQDTLDLLEYQINTKDTKNDEVLCEIAELISKEIGYKRLDTRV